MFKITQTINKKLFMGLTLLAMFIVVSIVKPTRAQAYVNNPQVPPSVQSTLEAACPSSDTAPGQTIGILYFNPAGIQSTNRTGTTGMYATAAMCTNSNYNQVRDISIFILSYSRYAGNGSINFASTNFPLMNIPINDFQHASGPASNSASFTNLSDGWNCWTIVFDMSAKYGTSSSNIPGTGSSNLCVYFTLKTDIGSCNILSYPATINPGQSFSASFSVTNGGTENWPTGGYPKVSNYEPRYKLGSASPDNTTRWGVTRLELPGTMTGFGPIFYPGTTWAPMAYSFTAPTTPGTYNFSWRILQENTAGKNNIGSCTKQIIVNTPPPSNATVQVLKMDNSGVSTNGSTEPWPSFGGDCYSEVYGYSCGNGTLANYPFSDDCIKIDGGACSTENPVINSSLTAGSHTVTVTANGTANSPWTLVGYSICGNNSASCTFQYLTKTSSINANTTGTMNYNFQSGVYYYLRWIYTNTGAATTCSPSAKTLDINESFQFTATGGNGTYAWSSSPAATSATAAGNKYTVSYNSEGIKTITVTSNGQSANCSVTVARKPYFRAYGGDVSATGLGFSGNCVSSSSANLIAYNQGSAGAGGAFAGGGSQLAVFASGQITEFASAFARSAVPLAAKGLMFANEQVGDYGGNWNGGDCIPDFYSKARSTDTKLVGPTVMAGRLISPNADPALSKITIYVDGDAFIDGNITYAAGFPGLYTTTTMPSFRLIAKGNIYVNATVTQLDGIYIAQSSNATNGRFYSCAFRSALVFRPPTVVGSSSPELLDSAAGCNRKLTVYGAVVAQSIKLLRTNGSIQSATSGEVYTSANQAETFIYTPEVWLGVQGGQKDDDAIGGLAPIL